MTIRAVGTPPPLFDVGASLAQLRARALLSSLSLAECDQRVRELAAVPGGAPLPAQPLETFERLLAAYYGVGLGARGRHDRFLILSASGRMGYAIDRPAVACLARLAGDVDLAHERESDHSGWIVAGDERHRYDWLSGLGSLTAAFNAALRTAAVDLFATWRGGFAASSGESLHAWLLRPAGASAPSAPDLISVMFGG